jgi:hypothetical protein
MKAGSADARVLRLLWVAALLAMGFVALWPALAGMIAVNDDIKFVRVPSHQLPLARQIADMWSGSPSFRPVELVVSASCDERTLRAPLALPLHLAGLVGLCLALVKLAHRVLPGRGWVAPMAILWVALSPGTSCSVWQIDTVSQTWSAALGLWAVEVAWHALDAARNGRSTLVSCTILGCIFALGVNVKETFYGWSAGVGLALIGATAWLLVRDRRAALRLGWTLFPVVALPVAHLALRWMTGSMSRSLELKQENRYQLEFGMNLLINAAQSTAGAVGTGPFHGLSNEAAPLLVRVLPLLTLVAEACLLAIMLEFVVLRRARGQRGFAWPAVLICVIGLLSLSVTFPMGSVSELYGFGANACVALLLAAAFTAICQEARSRMIRWVSIALMGFAMLAGAIGLSGRASHFERTWRVTRSVNQQILAFMDTRPEAPKYFDAPQSTIYFPADCRPSRSHGSYIMPAAQAIDIINTVDWMKRLHPRYPVTFSIDQDAPNPNPYELQIDCSGAADVGNW